MATQRLAAVLCAALLPGLSAAQTWVPQNSGVTASLRGISVVSAPVAWASGSGGTVLRTLDGGAHWITRPVPNAARLDFRGVHAFSADRAIVMASGEGPASVLLETGDGGLTWKTVLPNPDAHGFFDALVFANPREGAVLGDPVDGHFVLLATHDAGATWNRIATPAALPGEGAFAASNSGLVLGPCRKSHACDIWFATGGASVSRVFHLRHGAWATASAPVRAAAPGAGIFSLAVVRSVAVAVGGDYSKPREDERNAAVLTGFSSAWSPPSRSRPRGYRSSVAFLRDRKLFIATGPTGSETSRDNGQSWTPFGDVGYNAIGGVSTSACWAVGPQGRIARLRTAH